MNYLRVNSVQLKLLSLKTTAGFVSRPGHTKDHHKNGTNCLPALHACVRVGV